MMTSETHQHELALEIDGLLARRTEFRRLEQWEKADEIKRKLWKPPYKVKVFDYAEKSDWVPRRQHEVKPEKSIEWSEMTMKNRDEPQHHKSITDSTASLPLIIATVDTPHYRERCEETIVILQRWQNSCLSQKFRPEPCDLLKLQDHPSISVKGILLEGWRRVLLPRLTEQYANEEFVLVAEDDIRFPPHTSPQSLHDSCANVFDAHPDVSVLSLGHAWKDICKQHDGASTASLLEFLSSSKHAGIHATTLLAVRLPCHALLQALNDAKPTHLDQFLFHSTRHDVSIALCDPPLAGWAEVGFTLTKSGSGHRRQGGGRRGFVPPPRNELKWIKRRVIDVQPSTPFQSAEDPV